MHLWQHERASDCPQVQPKRPRANTIDFTKRNWTRFQAKFPKFGQRKKSSLWAVFWYLERQWELYQVHSAG